MRSRSCVNLEKSCAEGLLPPHPTGQACVVAASCVQICPKWLPRQKQFSKEGTERDVRAILSVLPVLEQGARLVERLGQHGLSAGHLKQNKLQGCLL